MTKLIYALSIVALLTAGFVSAKALGAFSCDTCTEISCKDKDKKKCCKKGDKKKACCKKGEGEGEKKACCKKKEGEAAPAEEAAE